MATFLGLEINVKSFPQNFGKPWPGQDTPNDRHIQSALHRPAEVAATWRIMHVQQCCTSNGQLPFKSNAKYKAK